LAVFTEFLLKPKDSPWGLHLKSVGSIAARQSAQSILTVAFLPYDAVISLDAVSRTLWRLIFTRRHLLEWQTANDVERESNGRLQSFFAAMWSSPALAVGFSALLFVLGGAVWSPTHQPTLENKPGYEAIFSQARAEFRARE
jgi:hypothetical protein